jgi:hypothetical protein
LGDQAKGFSTVGFSLHLSIAINKFSWIRGHKVDVIFSPQTHSCKIHTLFYFISPYSSVLRRNIPVKFSVCRSRQELWIKKKLGVGQVNRLFQALVDGRQETQQRQAQPNRDDGLAAADTPRKGGEVLPEAPSFWLSLRIKQVTKSSVDACNFRTCPWLFGISFGLD